MDPFDGPIADITRSLEWMRNARADKASRYDIAARAGAELAGEVDRYCQDPEGVGRDALDAARARFMGMHAGNFTQSGWDAAHLERVA